LILKVLKICNLLLGNGDEYYYFYGEQREYLPLRSKHSRNK
jgi:hypothetical protein